MLNKKTIIILFLIMALVQLFVPAKMIFDYEHIIRAGEAYKFKIAPVDPLDPFRGKYITLEFKDVTASVADPAAWKNNEDVYVVLQKDKYGFAAIHTVSKTRPSQKNHVEARVGFVGSTNDKKIFIKFPFDRFYMEETKASDAETLYREAARDSGQVAYAMVYIKDGNAALTDVFINDVSIQKIVDDYNKKHEE